MIELSKPIVITLDVNLLKAISTMFSRCDLINTLNVDVSKSRIEIVPYELITAISFYVELMSHESIG